jgi:hypothetical protein
MTFQGKNGKQYVAITAAGGLGITSAYADQNERIYVFALPEGMIAPLTPAKPDVSDLTKYEEATNSQRRETQGRCASRKL